MPLPQPTRETVLSIVQGAIDQLAESVGEISKAAQALPDAQTLLTRARMALNQMPGGQVVASDAEIDNAYVLLGQVQAGLTSLANQIPANHPTVAPARSAVTTSAANMHTTTGKLPPTHPK
jgi:outer membrane protein TolC